jgi:hypothetical protein
VATARTERTARVRRILSRAAVVLGGAVAGTAAAWLLSTSAASADTTQPGITQPEIIQPVVEVLDAVPAEAAPDQLPQYVEQIVSKAQTPAPPKELTAVVEQVKSNLNLPVRPQRGETTTSASLRMLTLEDHEAPSVVQPLEAASQTAPVVEDQAYVTSSHDYGRQPVTESSRRAPPSHDREPSLPSLPPLPAPLAPPTAPAASCSSCGHGSDDEPGTPVSTTWLNPRSGLATSRELRMITQHVATAVGEQPGVTPD